MQSRPAGHVQAAFETSELTISTPRDLGCVIVLSHASIAASKPSRSPAYHCQISAWGGEAAKVRTTTSVPKLQYNTDGSAGPAA